MTEELKNENSTEEEPVIYSWYVFPAGRNWKITLAVTLFIVVFPVLIALTMESSAVFYGIFAFIILFLSLLSFFTKTEYIFTPNLIKIKGLVYRRTRKWSEFRSYYHNKKGILLSPFIEPSRLENFRGQYLLWEPQYKDKILEIVKTKINIEDEDTELENSENLEKNQK